MLNLNFNVQSNFNVILQFMYKSTIQFKIKL